MGFLSGGGTSAATPKTPDTDANKDKNDQANRPFYPQSMWKTYREDGWKPPASSTLTAGSDQNKYGNGTRTLLGN